MESLRPQLPRTYVMEQAVFDRTRPEPLRVPPALEPVCYSLPNQERKSEFESFMNMTGYAYLIPEVWRQIENFNPLHAEHQPRMGYTKEQRIWVKHKRDESKDQAPFPHIESRKELQRLGLATHAYIEALTALELHHIWPQSFLQAYFGLDERHNNLINSAENGITLSRMSHSGLFIPGINEARHPDINEARRNYGFNKETIGLMLHNHFDLARQGIKFWVSGDDREMCEIARVRTERMRELHAKREQLLGRGRE